MNALWLTRIAEYKNSPLALATAKKLVDTKIRGQHHVLSHYKYTPTKYNDDSDTLELLSLYEAREAHRYWQTVRKFLPTWCLFTARKPHAPDVANQLFDIGYHHLAMTVRRLLEQHAIPGDMGLLHTAHTAKSAPLVYDLMEMFRADLVDAEVIRFLRGKKQPIENITQHHIGHLLGNINKRSSRLYYLKEFKQCHTYKYYTELQILKFERAINHKEVFEPLYLPYRHDTRCRTHQIYQNEHSGLKKA